MHIDGTKLTDVLRDHGFRITSTRRSVCEVIAAHHAEHLSAADIHRLTAAGDTTVDVATVYRTLEALEEAGAVRHTHIGHGPTVYHLAEEAPHQHLVCSSCGATISVSTEVIADLVDAITGETGFVPDVQHFALSGICAACST